MIKFDELVAWVAANRHYSGLTFVELDVGHEGQPIAARELLCLDSNCIAGHWIKWSGKYVAQSVDEFGPKAEFEGYIRNTFFDGSDGEWQRYRVYSAKLLTLVGGVVFSSRG